MNRRNDEDNAGNRRNDSHFEEEQRVRHKQQRLLLLRHASRCIVPEPCSFTRHCRAMKELWVHIAVCRDRLCSVRHCVSSRYILSHYRRCRDDACRVCVPVRRTSQSSERRDLFRRRSEGNMVEATTIVEDRPVEQGPPAAQRRRLDPQGNFVRTRNGMAEESTATLDCWGCVGPKGDTISLATFLNMYKVVATAESDDISPGIETTTSSVSPNNGNTPDDCPVCLAPLLPPFAQLHNCQHKLHVHCLAQVATFQSTCPTCRRELARESVHDDAF